MFMDFEFGELHCIVRFKGTRLSLILPKPREPIRRQRRIPRRRLQIPMPKIMRQRAGVMPVIGQLVSGRMPQHVRMHWEGQLGRLARTLNHPQEPRRCDRRTGLGYKHIGARPLQWPQSPQLRPVQGMHALNPALSPVLMQAPMPEIDLCPTKVAKLGCPQPMSIC